MLVSSASVVRIVTEIVEEGEEQVAAEDIGVAKQIQIMVVLEEVRVM
jgi:hypothetical protein